MRAGLTQAQKAVLQAIKDLTVDGVSPSYDEIRARVGMTSRGQVSQHLTVLKRKGRVDWEPQSARTLRVLDDVTEPAAFATLPVERLRAAIEDAVEALAAQIGHGAAADEVARLLARMRALARRAPTEPIGKAGTRNRRRGFFKSKENAMSADQELSPEQKLKAEGPSPHAGDDAEHRNDTKQPEHAPAAAAVGDPQRPDGGPADGAD